MTHGLTQLADSRDALLLAEVAAFLHDWQKCIGYWKKIGAQFDPSDIASVLERFKPQDPLNPSTSTESSSLKQLIEQGKDPSRARHSSDWRIRLLGTCHSIAHVDKPAEPGLGEQTPLIASIFGFETSPHENSQRLLEAVNNISQRHIFLKKLEQAFNDAVGDTRRPLNEVRLWEWGAATAAFWKAIAARYVLEDKVTEDNLKWRILDVRFDGLGFLEKSLTIGDLLGRQSALQVSLNCVRKLLEETYPIGNEVYRDENGSAFIVPDLEGDSDGKRLHSFLANQILKAGWQNELNGELKPRIDITEAHEKGLVLHKSLELPLPKITPFEDCSNRWWKEEVTDICTVCGVRPQGWGTSSKEQKREAKSRNICHVCLERRDKRAKTFLENLHETDKETVRNTIWIDEVADENGRLALIVGQFNLNNWLNGEMIKSLLAVCNPASDTNKKPSFISKEPSFARIQRVWETTQRFWQKALTDIPDGQLPKIKGRLIIEPSNLIQFRLQRYGNYDLVLGMTRLSVLHDNGKLITTDNLRYLAKQLGAKSGEYASDETAAEFVRSQLLNQQVPIEEPTGYGSPNKLQGKLNISKVTVDATEYSSVIPILAEPRTFMALVPADKSLEVIKAIQTKYEREMGKVRNRLPLHLGVVYFQRRTPLRSALDAGRQMLSYKSPNDKQLWQVQSVDKGQFSPEKEKLAKDIEKNEIITKQFEETITLKLTQDDRTITWHVPTKMGDGNTPDNWYPYVFLETNGDDNPVNGRQRAIKSQRPGETTPCWLVHVADLREGDQIYFTPSTFDFEFLDSTARRFEIYYDENGRRPRRTRPFYLEDLDRFDILWKILKNLENSQQHQVIYAIEATRELWYGQNGQDSQTDPTFRQFVTDTLANAAWPKDQPWKSIAQDQQIQLIDAGVRGELADLADLYMEILKQR
ncbi:CRISPR-associated protein, Csx11 family [Leptolyngbyaceae cyanobacterium JSC-12]|nr:CRISPR-associated protein, Csx11 family [Leptolyngbyaceae cyanobacterium JSC-12]